MKPWFLLLPVFTIAYQIFIKMAVTETMPWLVLAIGCEIIGFVFWMKILSTHNLSKAFPLSAVGYVLVLCSGWLVFGEEVMAMQIIGSLFIMGGVWLIGTNSENKKI